MRSYRLQNTFNTTTGPLDTKGDATFHLLIDDQGSETPDECDITIQLDPGNGFGIYLQPWEIIERIVEQMNKTGWMMNELHLTGFHYSTKGEINKSPWYEELKHQTRSMVKTRADQLLVAKLWDGRYSMVLIISRPDRAATPNPNYIQSTRDDPYRTDSTHGQLRNK